MSIEVSITPTKTGRVGIKEGDDLKQLAKNFCKAYSLGKDMEESLVEQLEGHLENYWKMKEKKVVQKKPSIKPTAREETETVNIETINHQVQRSIEMRNNDLSLSKINETNV